MLPANAALLLPFTGFQTDLFSIFMRNWLTRLENQQLVVKYMIRGCTGFDTGTDAQWGMPSLDHARKNRFNKLTANDERFALAA